MCKRTNVFGTIDGFLLCHKHLLDRGPTLDVLNRFSSVQNVFLPFKSHMFYECGEEAEELGKTVQTQGKLCTESTQDTLPENQIHNLLALRQQHQTLRNKLF